MLKFKKIIKSNVPIRILFSPIFIFDININYALLTRTCGNKNILDASENDENFCENVI